VPSQKLETRQRSSLQRKTSVSGLRRQEQLRNRPKDNSDLQRKVPVLQVLKIARDSILNVGIISRFAAKTAHLSQSGNSRLNESADMVACHYFRKLGVMLEQCGRGPTILISPRSTFQNCGISSMLNFRKNRPSG